MRDNHRAARELQQGVFQRAQGFDIQVVGWFIEQQDVTADLQQFRQCRRPRSPPDSSPTRLPSVDAFEVKAAHVGAARHLGVADLHDIQAARHFFPHGLTVVHRVAELIDGSQLNGFTRG